MKWMTKVCAIMLCAIMLTSLITPVQTSAATTQVYQIVALTKLSLKKGKLSIKSGEIRKAKYDGKKRFDQYKWKKMKSKTLSLKVSKKCRWCELDFFDKFSKKGKKRSYKSMKADLKSSLTPGSEWEFGFFVVTKGNKIVKVMIIYS